MNLKTFTDNWKCIGVIVATAVALCGTAVGFDSRYAKSVDLKQLQMAQNYSNFQMRLAALMELCSKSPCDANTKQTIRWLQSQIKMIENQMGMTN